MSKGISRKEEDFLRLLAANVNNSPLGHHPDELGAIGTHRNHQPQFRHEKIRRPQKRRWCPHHQPRAHLAKDQARCQSHRHCRKS